MPEQGKSKGASRQFRATIHHLKNLQGRFKGYYKKSKAELEAWHATASLLKAEDVGEAAYHVYHDRRAYLAQKVMDREKRFQDINLLIASLKICPRCDGIGLAPNNSSITAERIFECMHCAGTGSMRPLPTSVSEE
jgi:hypothetical protein